MTIRRWAGVGRPDRWLPTARRHPRTAVVAATAVALGLTAVVVAGSADDPQPQAMAPTTAEGIALRDARNGGAPVRVDEQTSETAEVWARPDGQLEARLSAAPVRARRGAGWVPVDLGLRAAADGSVVPGAHPNDLRLTGATSDGTHELAAVGLGDKRVGMHWTGRLPAPVLDGPKATYVDALTGVDLVVRATRTGFEQSLIVKNRAAVAQVRRVVLPLSGPGASAHRRDKVGTITLTDRAGAAAATIPAPLMWDARTTTAGVPARSAPIRTTVERATAGLALALTPDLGWLRDSRTTFPVTLDPTVAPISATFDTYVQERVTTNMAGEDDLRIGALATTPFSITRSFLTWNTAVLNGKQITAASVKFWNYWSQVCSGKSWEIWTTTEANASTRWAAQPQWVGSRAAAVSTSTKGGPTSCDGVDDWATIGDAKAFFQHFATARSNKAFMGVRATDETDDDAFKQFRPTDGPTASQVPQASVTYNAYPAVTARSTVPAAACATGTARPLVNSLTPQLKATVTDADNPLTVDIQWAAVGATAPIGSQRFTNVASGTTVTATVPAGAFTDGGRYQWRVLASDGVAGSSTWSSYCEMTTYVTSPPVSGCDKGVDSDYNGDGVSDLAVGDPDATVDGKAKAGQVTIVYGGTGDTATLRPGLPEVPGAPQPADGFGHALATYDANRDGCSDLAVTAPFAEVGAAADAGRTALLLGSPQGLGKGPATTWLDQNTAGWGDDAEAGDWFGYAVTAGATATGEPYLAVGVPGEDLGAGADAGLVHYRRGTAHLTMFAGAGVSGSPENDDRLGYSLAGSPHHLAVGSPGEALGAATWAGAVQLFTHEIAGTALKGAGTLGQDVQETAEANDNFGASVAMAPYRPEGAAAGQPRSLLLVGVPGEDVGAVVDAGMVQRFDLNATGFTKLGDLTQDTPGVAGTARAGNYFGEQVRVANTAPADVSTAQTLQAAVGAPGEDADGALDAGAVSVFAATGNPLSSADTRIARVPDALPGEPTTQELLGAHLGSSVKHLHVADPYRGGTVYSIAWADLAQGRTTPAGTVTAGTDGVAAGTAFGAAIG